MPSAHDPLPVIVYAVIFVCCLFTLYWLQNFYRKKKRNARLGYQGQMAVGLELNQLMLEGYHVYHDFAADHFNIGHIVVGRSGIFTVATHTRSKPRGANGRQGATVEYNGKMLDFPDGEDFKIIEQAEQQASWLSEWISRAIGEPVAARAIVALPGWSVKRTSAEGISVVNPGQFTSLFKHIKPRILTDAMITRIVDQLEQKCRNGPPDTVADDGAQPVA